MTNVKEKLIRTSLVISIVGIASVNAMSKEATQSVQFGNSICFVRGSGVSCKSKTLICNESGRKQESVEISSSGGVKVQINDQGNLIIQGDTIDDEEEQRVVVEDLSGRITFDTRQKNKTGMEFLGEEGGDEKIWLKLGSKITLRSCLDASQNTIVTYDELIKLKSDKDGSEHFVLKSTWQFSQLVTVETRDYIIEDAIDCFKRIGRDKKVSLHRTGEEIGLLDNFLNSDQKGREELFDKLLILTLTKLLVILHEHGFIKEFQRNDFDCASQLLGKKISGLLKQATSKDLSCWSTEIEWFRKINTWPLEAQRRIENVLRRVIRPVPKVLFKQDNVNGMIFNPASMRAEVYYKDDRGEIIDLENGRVLFRGNNIKCMDLNLAGTRVLAFYKDDRGEIIDLEVEGKDERVLFQGNNIKNKHLNEAGTRVLVFYKDDRGVIIDLEAKDEDERVLFRGNNIKDMNFHNASMRIEVYYQDGRREIVGLENGRVLFRGDNIEEMDCNSADTMVKVRYEDGRGEVIDLEVEDDNKRIIFEGDNIEEMDFNSAGTMVKVCYEGGRGEIVNLENRRVVFEGDNIEGMGFNEAGTRISVVYNNRGGVIIDLEVEDEDERVLFRGNNIKYMHFNEAGTRISVVYNNGRGVIIDLEVEGEDERVLFRGNNIKYMYFNEPGRGISVSYKDDRAEIIDLEVEGKDERVLFQGNNIKSMMYLNEAGTRISVVYNNGGGVIIDLEVEGEDERVLFRGNNIEDMGCNSAGTRVGVGYEDGRGVIIDLEDYDRDIIFINLKLKELLAIYLLKNLNPSNTGNLATYCFLWKSLDTNLKQKLQGSYLSKEVIMFLDREVMNQKLRESYLLEEAEVFLKEKQEKEIAATEKRKKCIKSIGLMSRLILFFMILYETIHKCIK